MAADSLVFVHLSDIHFRCWSGSTYDIDEDLRNELLLDATEVSKQLGQPQGILVTGDIAFNGIKEEYDTAKKWLTELCTELGRTLEHVWSVPGNHDVDWGYTKQSPTLAAIHNELRQSDEQGIDREIRRFLGDAEAAELIFRPVSEYNRFAAAFRCQIGPQKPTWQHDFSLNDGSFLRLHGLNSTMVSDHLDDIEKNVILGKYQVPKRVSGVAHLVMCHHPPDWWQDADNVEQFFNTRTKIELFGHKHTQRLIIINSTLRLVAGAVHPDRRAPNWKPCYNWLKISVSKSDGVRKLAVATHPRTWSEETSKFIPDYNNCDGDDHRDLLLDLEPWVSKSPESNESQPESSGYETTRTSTQEKGPGTEIMDPVRVLTYRFFDLAHVVRIDIARELNLLRDEDEGLKDYELFGRVLRRAAQEKLLAELWDKIEERHGDNKYTSNPFRIQ